MNLSASQNRRVLHSLLAGLMLLSVLFCSLTSCSPSGSYKVDSFARDPEILICLSTAKSVGSFEALRRDAAVEALLRIASEKTRVGLSYYDRIVWHHVSPELFHGADSSTRRQLLDSLKTDEVSQHDASPDSNLASAVISALGMLPTDGTPKAIILFTNSDNRVCQNGQTDAEAYRSGGQKAPGGRQQRRHLPARRSCPYLCGISR